MKKFLLILLSLIISSIFILPSTANAAPWTNYLKKKADAKAEAERKAAEAKLRAQEKTFTQEQLKKLIVFQPKGSRAAYETNTLDAHYYEDFWSGNIKYQEKHTYTDVSSYSMDLGVSNNMAFTAVKVTGEVSFSTKSGYRKFDQYSSSKCWSCADLRVDHQSDTFYLEIQPRSTATKTLYAEPVFMNAFSPKIKVPIDSSTIKITNVKYSLID